MAAVTVACSAWVMYRRRAEEGKAQTVCKDNEDFNWHTGG